ncbi:MAG: adenylosuccinate synthetase, partial [Ardenticatenales bacterium]|nr:adenylosuccinate synthetase [Ardenticatenales bacterium]
SGPMPKYINNDAAIRLRGTGEKQWDEFGTTTGRPRRVGWLDLVALKFSRRVNGLTELALTKLDILSGIDSLPVCVGYECDGTPMEEYPAQLGTLAACQPVYEMLPGWDEEIMGLRDYDELPENAKAYIRFIERYTGIPVSIVSVGPAPEHTIYR